MASAPREVFGDLATTAFVESSHLFKSLDPEAKRDLVQLAHVVTWEAGETVSPEGDDGFFLIVDGSAAVVRGGAETAQLARGACFGEGRVLAPGLRPASLAARTQLTAVVFPAPVIAAMCERFPKLKKLLETLYAARTRDLSPGA